MNTGKSFVQKKGIENLSRDGGSTDECRALCTQMEIWSEVDGTWGWLGCGEKQMMPGGLLVCGTLYFLACLTCGQ